MQVRAVVVAARVGQEQAVEAKVEVRFINTGNRLFISQTLSALTACDGARKMKRMKPYFELFYPELFYMTINQVLGGGNLGGAGFAGTTGSLWSSELPRRATLRSAYFR